MDLLGLCDIASMMSRLFLSIDDDDDDDWCAIDLHIEFVRLIPRDRPASHMRMGLCDSLLIGWMIMLSVFLDTVVIETSTAYRKDTLHHPLLLFLPHHGASK